MKLMTSRFNGIKSNMLITILVIASQVALPSDYDYVRYVLRRNKSETPVRSNVRIHRQELLATMVGTEDLASQTLSYTPRVDKYEKHIAGPVNIGGRPLLPVVHHGRHLVHLVGINKRAHREKTTRELQKPTIALPTVNADQEKFENAVRSTILAFARQQALTQRSADDASARQGAQ